MVNPVNMVVSVYLLQLFNRTHFTGITNNIQRRLSEHQSGYSKSTRHYLPVKLIFTQEFPNRKKARRMEVKIKNLGAKKHLNKLRFSP